MRRARGTKEILGDIGLESWFKADVSRWETLSPQVKVALAKHNPDRPMRPVKITGAQIRAARAFLRWTIGDLAKKANVGLSTIQEVEKFDGEPRIAPSLKWRSDARMEAVAKMRDAFEKAGIKFLPESNHGVGLRWRPD